MVFMCTAMYSEAYPFIQKLNLKKDFLCHKFQIFKNKEVVLIITGIGKIKAAIGVTYLFSKYNFKASDVLINIGVCGTNDKNIEIGTLFLVNKIIEEDTKKTFYPDMIFKNPFKETSIETCSLSEKNSDKKYKGKLVDMEASAVYEAALMFMECHQIFFIKIVSDHLNNEKLTKDLISKLIYDKSLQVLEWISSLKEVFTYDKSVLSKLEKEKVKIISEKLKFSSTMKSQLKQILIYFKLQNGSLNKLFDYYLDIECSSKNEGKRCFAEFKKRII